MELGNYMVTRISLQKKKAFMLKTIGIPDSRKVHSGVYLCIPDSRQDTPFNLDIMVNNCRDYNRIWCILFNLGLSSLFIV
jgi:hypothetical protein